MSVGAAGWGAWKIHFQDDKLVLAVEKHPAGDEGGVLVLLYRALQELLGLLQGRVTGFQSQCPETGSVTSALRCRPSNHRVHIQEERGV